MDILGISRGSVYALLKRKDFHWVQLCGGHLLVVDVLHLKSKDMTLSKARF